MVENGCGFDVASKKELDQVLKYNINKENIVFANPCKPNSHIKFAAGKKCFIVVLYRFGPIWPSWWAIILANQVKMMTFDNEHELKKIKKLHPNAQGEFRRPSILEIKNYL